MTATITQLLLRFVLELLLWQPAPMQNPDADFAPGLFIGAVLMIAVLLVLIGIGLVLGLAIVGLAAAGLAFGVLSASVLVGYLNKSVHTGLRTFVLIVSALLGALAGIVLIAVIESLQHIPFSVLQTIVSGGIAGSVGGYFMGLLFLRLVGYLKATIAARYRLS